MIDESLYHFGAGVPGAAVGKASQMLRLIRAAQPISRVHIASRLGIDPSTVSENIKPLVANGVLNEETVLDNTGQRRTRVLSFNGHSPKFAGVNLGVRHSQVGLTTLRGEITDEIDFETPSDAYKALSLAREHLDAIIRRDTSREIGAIGVSVPGMTD